MPKNALLTAAILILAAGAPPAEAQNALGDGRVLDANPRVGSGGLNPAGRDFAAEVRFRNAIVTGNAPGATAISIEVGEIPAGSQVEISYRVVIDADLSADVTEISNQGLVHHDNDATPFPTNDPATAAASDATITELDPDPTAEEPTEQPSAPDLDGDALFLPHINH